MPAAPRAPIGKDRLRSIVARSPRDSAAGVRSGPAQVEALERHPVIRRADHRPRAEQLIEAHLAVEDVAADEPEAALEVEWRMDLPADDRLGETRRVRVDGGDDLVGRSLALVVPASACAEVVAEVLAEEARDVLAFRREAWVERGG